jgi:hypothetical protein
MPRPRSAILTGLLAILAAGCQYLYPSDDGGTRSSPRSDKPLFDAEFYSRNAKEYFDAGRYGLARDQWELQLKLEPHDWLARLGVASCDYFLGVQAQERGDLKTARELLDLAESRIRSLWDGSIESDTLLAFRGGSRQWQAALYLARTQRALAAVGRIQALRAAQREQAAEGAERSALAREREILEEQARENSRAALDLFARLARMENASEDAVLNLGEMLAEAGRAEEAEREFLRYVAIAERTRAERLELRRQIESSSEGTEENRRLTLQYLDESLARNAAIQSGVHDRLAALRFDRAVLARQKARDPSRTAAVREAAAQEADAHLEAALQSLSRARALTPDRTDLLVKTAQCEGELGRYRDAIDHLDAYIEACSRGNVSYNADLNRAFRLREEYKELLKRAMAGS